MGNKPYSFPTSEECFASVSSSPDLVKKRQKRQSTKYVKLRWWRLNQGKVRHLCFMSSYAISPPGDLETRAMSLCGRRGAINMRHYRVPAGPYEGSLIKPERFPECKECLAVLGDAIPPRLRKMK